MKKLAIIGAGDLGQQIAHYAEQSGFEIAGFFDDTMPSGTIAGNHTVLGAVADISEKPLGERFDELIIAIGYRHREAREALFDKWSQFAPFATIVHPSSIVDHTSELAQGVVVLPGCIVSDHVVLKENVFLNVGVVVTHDSTVGAHSFLSPTVSIAGFVSIGERNFLGINTTVIDNITTVDACQTGGGTVVIKNLEKAGLYVGNPARFVR